MTQHVKSTSATFDTGELDRRGPEVAGPLPAGPARSRLSWFMLAVGLIAALALPWIIYPAVAMDIAAWALFAISVDLLLGYTGLLSFGHAAFWGLQTVASRVHFREQYRALVGHALVWARVLLLLRALSVPGDSV